MEIPLPAMPMMTSQILKSVDFTKAQNSRYLENKIFFFKLKKWVLLNHAPTSTQLIPTSTQLISTSTQLIPASNQHSASPSTLLEPIYRTQLGWEIQNCPFWLKIGTYDISNLGQKSQSYLFCVKIDTRGILRILILILKLIF